MTGDYFTAILAERVMGWRVGPDRFIMPERSWIPRWRFQPLRNLDHSFQLLEKAASTFTLATTPDGTFTAWVRVGDHIGVASGEPKAAAITVAIARAIGIDVPEDSLLSAPLRNALGEGRER